MSFLKLTRKMQARQERIITRKQINMFEKISAKMKRMTLITWLKNLQTVDTFSTTKNAALFGQSEIVPSKIIWQ